MFSMSMLIILATILQSFSISLGVGSSTIAVLSFFSAIADGAIDDTERRMLGVVYVLLRVAMVGILIATLILLAVQPKSTISTFTIEQLFVLFILFMNAVLMTAHIMPSTFGPAIQAGSWYTLGVLSALKILDITNITLTQFIFSYLTGIVLTIAIINGVMSHLRHKKLLTQKSGSTPVTQ
jgi:hypothetical protein